MNISEALKSGKRIRRKGWINKDCWAKRDGYGIYRMMEEDLLADDWEVEEKKIEITLTDFWAAVSSVNAGHYARSDRDTVIADYLRALQRELGL